jgi:hypothetical protein
VIRDFAPRVLEQLVTEQGTKQPRSEQDLAAATSLRRGEVRAVLNGLGEAALEDLVVPHIAALVPRCGVVRSWLDALGGTDDTTMAR